MHSVMRDGARKRKTATGRRAVALAGLLAVAAAASGCLQTTGPDSGGPSPAEPAGDGGWDRLEALLDRGAFEEALRAHHEIARTDPERPGLEAMRVEILNALLDQRVDTLADRMEQSRLRMSVDAAEQAVIPSTYQLGREAHGLPMDRLVPESRMREVLDKRVSMHLKGADLSLIIETLGQDPELNLIADSEVGQGRTLDVDAADVPLREILEYISRNLEVAFHVGDNVVWVTAPDARRAGPLETRVFRLRKGLQFQGSDWGEPGAESALGDIATLTRKATVLPSGATSIESILRKFVPEVEGAEMMLDTNTHTLLVRNTSENLELISRIVDALDIDPPQVLIEARFIEVAVADLRELGLEWMLDSDFVVTSRPVLRDGVLQADPNLIIEAGGGVRYLPFASDEAGPFPLGPQGAFGQVRSGNPQTDAQGLNLGMRGVLTRPEFRAVLHALEISGKGRTISVPRVTTLNNNPAKLRDGQDLRYFDEFQAQAFNLVDAGNQRYTITVLIPKGAPAMEELGITLVAVPSVGADRNTISLLLNPTISRLEGFVSYQDDTAGMVEPADRIRQVVAKLPIVSRREIQTKLVVESGQTVVMGGLIDTVMQDTVHRVPVLGSLPFVGALFRRTGTTEQSKNLLIFVTATVISERGETLRISSPEPETGPAAGRRTPEP